MPINFPKFETVNYGNILANSEQIKGARQRNRVLGMQADEQQNLIGQRQKAQEIRSTVDGMPGQIAQMEDAGLYEQADQLRQTYLSTRVNTINVIEKLRENIDATNWKEFRADMLASGALDSNMMPVDYDPDWFRTKLDKEKGDLKKLVHQWGDEGKLMAQDIVFQDGEELWRGSPYETTASRSEGRQAAGGGGDSGMSASDSNSIRSAAAEVYGGFWDPIQETYGGLNRQQAVDVLSLAEEASRLYRTSGGQLSHTEAVARAARNVQRDGEFMQVPQIHNPMDPAGILPRQ